MVIFAMATCEIVRAQILVPTNSTWRFRKGTSEASSPTNAWRSLAFDDCSWSLGDASFYYDADPAPVYTGNTLLGDMQNGYTCIFMRQKLVILLGEPYSWMIGDEYTILRRDSFDAGSWWRLIDVAHAPVVRVLRQTDSAGGEGERYYRVVTPQTP